MITIKTCENCPHYTGIQCHGHGEYYGQCLKGKKPLVVDDNTPCLNDKSNLIKAYYKLADENKSLKWQIKELEFYKLRYESKCRTINKMQNITLIACKYIAKENLPKWRKENLDYLMNYKIPLNDLEILAKKYEETEN